MTKTRTVAFLGIIFVALSYFAFFTSKPSEPNPQSIELSWKSFDDGIALARETNKKILVDVYTDWCTWCKKMDKEVYSNEDVKKVLYDKFIVVKLNAESGKQLTYNNARISERQFSQAVGVTGYPTTLFLENDSKPITLLPGFVGADKFVHVLNFVGDSRYKTETFQQYLSNLGSSK